jgi:ferrous iron transport protein B
MFDRGKAFVVRAGTLILASMVVVWALLYFPHTGTDAQGQPVNFDRRIAELEETVSKQQKELATVGDQKTGNETESLQELRDNLQRNIEATEEEVNHLREKWQSNSILGRLGKVIEPAVEPLGWDWRIGTAALASFPAREVVVGTLGIIYDAGKDQDEESETLRQKLTAAKWDAGSARAGLPVFTVPVALSIMVFFALCCQCAATLAVIRRETNSWRWPVFTFVYMTALAYLGALLTYQIGSVLG